MSGGRDGERCEIEVIVDKAQLAIVSKRLVIKVRINGEASADCRRGKTSERRDAAALIGGSSKNQ